MTRFILIVALLWASAQTWAREGRAGAPQPEQFSLFDVERRLASDGSRGPFRLSDRAVLAESEQVWVDGRLLERDLDYLVDCGAARLTFFFPLPRGTSIVVRFRQPPQVLRRVYRHRDLPETGEGMLTVRSGSPPSYVDDPSWTALRKDDGPRLEVGGSKRIQVAFGSDRNASLTQSLQVQVSGEVAEGVSLLAVLSDRDLPLYSGGGTQSLQELDRVFFQVRSQSFSAGLGDQDVVIEEGSFGRYRRRLQGVNLAVSLPGGAAEFYGAVSGGRWTTHRLTLTDGYQGPYRLGGGEGAGATQVMAGSERVHLDGQMLRRGAGQDYVIDYERGLLTFTPSRPVSSANRVTVSYQYLEGDGRRRLMGLRGSLAPGDARLRLGTTLIRETDGAQVLPAASGLPVSNRGLQQLASMDVAYAPLEGMAFSGEVAVSDLLADASDSGGGHRQRDGAFRLGVALSPRAVMLGERDMGRIRLTGTYRQVGAAFSGFERVDQVTDEGRWGWATEAEGEGERLGEVAVEYAPVEGIRLDAGYGRRSGRRSATRREVAAAVSKMWATDAQYRYEEILQGDGRLSRQRAEIATFVWKLRPGFRFASETALDEAVRESSLFYALALPGAGRPDGVHVREAAWDLSVGDEQRLGWTSTLSSRRTRLLDGGWRDSLRGWSHRHRARLADWHGISLFGEYSGSSTQTPQRPGDGRRTSLSRVQMRYTSPGGVLSQQITYRMSNTGAPDREPVFVYVGSGQGDFLWEDADGDGMPDREEFVADADGDYALFYGPDEGFRPVREAVLGTRLDVALKRLIKSPNGVWGRVLAGVALDLSLEADRQVLPGYSGVAPWQLHRFQTEDGVLHGQRDIRTRLHLFRYNRRASVRIDVRNRSRLDRTYSDGETEGLSEVGVQGRLRIGSRCDVEAELTHAERNREDEAAFAYGIRSSDIRTQGTWRPGNGWQFGMRTEWGREREGRRALRLSRLSLNPEVIMALPGRGRIRSGVGWTFVSASDRPPLFLGMAQGNQVGHNLLWQVGVDFRLAQYVTTFLMYDGRKRPERPVRHLGRMEMRATF